MPPILQSASEIQAWADRWRCILREQDAGEDQIATEQHLDLLLEELDEIAQADNASSHADLLEQINERLDTSLAGWHASLRSSLGEALTREVEQEVKRARQLVEDLQEREQTLGELEAELNKREIQLLERDAKTSRQRKAIAQTLRAQRAEMLLTSIREGQDEQKSLDELTGQLATKSEELHRLKKRCQELEAEMQQSDEGWQVMLTQANDRANELQEQLDAAKSNEEFDALTEELEQCKAELERLTLAAEERAAEERVAEGDLAENEERSNARIEELEHEVEKLHEEIDQLLESRARQAEELESIKDIAVDSNYGSESEEVQELERLLAEAKDAIQDLRGQNEDLAAQVAKQQVLSTASRPHVNFDQEGLSWEERKQLIMQQLEDEVEHEAGEEPEQTRKRIEVEEVVASTQKEIDRRDQEIEELRQIVEQQADTKQGVAIGAAAIGQMLDSDALVQEEREKLKAIQAEWEEKLRQAEIDLSMERAKLARERQELDCERQELAAGRPAAPANPPPDQDDSKGRTRKWLEHLGLREEKSD